MWWINLIQGLLSIAKGIVSILEWIRTRRRGGKNREIALASLDSTLLPQDIAILQHVSKTENALAVLYAREPVNSPMNTREGNEAKATLFDQLRESNLMQVINMTSLADFRVLAQKLESLRLIDYGPLAEPFESCE